MATVSIRDATTPHPQGFVVVSQYDGVDQFVSTETYNWLTAGAITSGCSTVMTTVSTGSLVIQGGVGGGGNLYVGDWLANNDNDNPARM
jgi:hypothetical protein